MSYVLVALMSLLAEAAGAWADKIIYVSAAGDTTLILTLDQQQVHALEDGLTSIPIWIRGAVQGKVDHCRTLMIQEWMPKLQADPEVKSVPVKEDDLVEFIFNRDDYEDRAEREAKNPQH